MINPNEINSGADYAQIVIDSILETEKTLPVDQQMPLDLLTHLTKLIETEADKHYAAYIIGKRETFLFSDIELTDLFDKAGELYVSDMIDGLVDKDMLEVSIDETGEFLYGLSELGKQVTEQQPKKRGRKPKK
jgi:hypothetical protein